MFAHLLGNSGHPFSKQIDAGLKLGMEITSEVIHHTQHRTKPLADSGDTVGATIATFVVAHAIRDWARRGPEATPPGSAPRQVWDLFEKTFGMSTEELEAAIKKERPGGE